MLQRLTRAAVVGALALAPLAAAAEDLTITSSVTGAKGATIQTQYMSASKVRSASGDTDTIVDLATGALTMVDNKKKVYWQTTPEEMKAAMAQLQQQMQGMGPLAEKMMGGKMAPVTVTKGTAPRKIAGYDTEHWIVAMGEGLKYEVWTASSLALPMNASYYDAMQANYAAMGPMGQRFKAIFDEMKKIKGFPLATDMSFSIMGRNQQTKTEATEVKKGAIPASAFEVPAGYKKEEAPFTKMGKKASD